MFGFVFSRDLRVSLWRCLLVSPCACALVRVPGLGARGEGPWFRRAGLVLGLGVRVEGPWFRLAGLVLGLGVRG